ncbi:hypothetical protein DAEQUDRAFT_730334 [Daedalea quercina L-15889]|uniref:Uncharacterized protein n=1 Tax=Daedalea quercina L-15889 TaxID=1314783 RepID=A0A165N0N3_9APHY|nr:hypothetical protein DAEQUDRAFT_730334 [Daedalea quercina L-15889]
MSVKEGYLTRRRGLSFLLESVLLATAILSHNAGQLVFWATVTIFVIVLGNHSRLYKRRI